MKQHLNPDPEIVKVIIEGLKNNESYCPCIYNSKGNPDYKCPCKDFRENKKVGETCYCGLYIKDSN